MMTAKLSYNQTFRLFKFPESDKFAAMKQYIETNIKNLEKPYCLYYKESEQINFIESETDLDKMLSGESRKIFIDDKNEIFQQFMQQQDKQQSDQSKQEEVKEDKNEEQKEEQPQRDQVLEQIKTLIEQFQQDFQNGQQPDPQRFGEKIQEILTHPDNVNKVQNIMEYIKNQFQDVFWMFTQLKPQFQQFAQNMQQSQQNGCQNPCQFFKDFKEKQPQVFQFFKNMKQQFCQNLQNQGQFGQSQQQNEQDMMQKMKLQGKLQKVAELVGHGKPEDYHDFVKDNIELDCTEIANMILLEKCILDSQQQEQQQPKVDEKEQQKEKAAESEVIKQADEQTQNISNQISEILGGEPQIYYQVVEHYKYSNYDVSWLIEQIISDETFLDKFI